MFTSLEIGVVNSSVALDVGINEDVASTLLVLPNDEIRSLESRNKLIHTLFSKRISIRVKNLIKTGRNHPLPATLQWVEIRNIFRYPRQLFRERFRKYMWSCEDRSCWFCNKLCRDQEPGSKKDRTLSSCSNNSPDLWPNRSQDLDYFLITLHKQKKNLGFIALDRFIGLIGVDAQTNPGIKRMSLVMRLIKLQELFVV